VEHVSEMRAALTVYDLPSFHSIANVFYETDRIGVDRRIKAGPAGAGIEFRIAAEKELKAGGRVIGPFLIKMVIFAGEGPFRAFFAEDIVLFGSQAVFPFSVREGHWIFCFCRSLGWIGVFFVGLSHSGLKEEKCRQHR